MSKSEKISVVLEKVFGVLAFLPIPISMIVWIFTEFPSRKIFGFSVVDGPIGFMTISSTSIPIMANLSNFLRFAGFMAYLPLAALQTYWLWQLKGLFGCYAQGKIFAAENTTYIKRTALAFLGFPFVSVFVGSALTLVLTASNPIGHRMVGVTFGTPEVTNILTGMVLVVIAWVMDEGRKLKEDADYTV
jgi:hypothetical protein